jgi:hypothetical protein
MSAACVLRRGDGVSKLEEGRGGERGEEIEFLSCFSSVGGDSEEGGRN